METWQKVGCILAVISVLGILMAFVSTIIKPKISRLTLEKVEIYGGDFYVLKNISNETLLDVTFYDNNNLTVKHFDEIKDGEVLNLRVKNFSTPFVVSHGTFSYRLIDSPTKYHFILRNTASNDLYDVTFYDEQTYRKLKHYDVIQKDSVFRIVGEDYTYGLTVVYADGSSETIRPNESTLKEWAD